MMRESTAAMEALLGSDSYLEHVKYNRNVQCLQRSPSRNGLRNWPFVLALWYLSLDYICYRGLCYICIDRKPVAE